MRLDRFICKSTQLNRQQASTAILAGRVVVENLSDIHPGYQVHEHHRITLDGITLKPRPSRYYMLNKPEGYLSSNVDGRYPSLFKLLPQLDAENLHIAGRLDRDTTGLVLITDDGRWSFNIISPESHCQKIYHVTLLRPITELAKQQLEQGVILSGLTHPTRPAQVQVLSEKEIALTISEGKYHQVKRMLKAVQNKVVALHRAQIGPLPLDLKVGDWRPLTTQEVAYFTPPPLAKES